MRIHSRQNRRGYRRLLLEVEEERKVSGGFVLERRRQFFELTRVDTTSQTGTDESDDVVAVSVIVDP